jgi:siroheme synthase (precorrin-2 oxidase/ferrochelatase)
MPGASLLLAFRAQPQSTTKPVLIIGSSALAVSRAFSALEASYPVIVLSPADACDELRWRAEQQQITLLPFDGDAAFGTLLNAHTPALVFVADTLSSHPARRTYVSAAALASECRARGIPVNVTDLPDLCDFTVASTHRFTAPVPPSSSSPSASDATPEKTPLQLAVVTNGQGCRLSARIRRDLVAALPRGAAAAVKRVGALRALAKDDDNAPEVGVDTDAWADEDGAPTPNRPVAQRSPSEAEHALERARRRMRWVAQVSEYWPYARLAALSPAAMECVLAGEPAPGALAVPAHDVQAHAGDSELGSPHALALRADALPPPPGRIFLLGSGPGHPGLLTVATRDVLTQRADVVLSDKLVPAAVLALIPAGVDVRIARKFPGNAEGAQNEMMEAAVELARKGLTVVRVSIFLLNFSWKACLICDNARSSSRATRRSTAARAKRCFTSGSMDSRRSSSPACRPRSRARSLRASPSRSEAPPSRSSFARASAARYARPVLYQLVRERLTGRVAGPRSRAARLRARAHARRADGRRAPHTAARDAHGGCDATARRRGVPRAHTARDHRAREHAGPACAALDAGRCRAGARGRGRAASAGHGRRRVVCAQSGGRGRRRCAGGRRGGARCGARAAVVRRGALAR